MLLPVLIVLLCSTGQLFAKQKQMSVQVKDGNLRASASFLGSVVGAVNYGDRITVIETKNAWIKVTAENPEISGWIHNSALSKKKIKLKAGDQTADLAASSGEVAMAGKGFSPEVEKKFKETNQDIDYTWVDNMEEFRVTAEQAGAFLKAGNITPAEGGAQ